MPSIQTYYHSMRSEDVHTFVAAVSTTLIIGGSLLWLLLRWLDTKFNVAPKPTIIKRREPAAAPTVALATPAAEAAAVPKERRTIPRGAQAALVERGQRLLADKEYKQALNCFLSLLFASIESEDKALPAHLTDCLRGVAECYKGMGQADVAVKFLQAERRVFEEMVVQAANPEGEKTPSIIASLFGKEDKNVPKRIISLSEVADACSKLGYHDIALAYRVKASALRHKLSGTPLDPDSEEASLLAKALSQCQVGKDATAQQSKLFADEATTAADE